MFKSQRNANTCIDDLLSIISDLKSESDAITKRCQELQDLKARFVGELQLEKAKLKEAQNVIDSLTLQRDQLQQASTTVKSRSFQPQQPQTQPQQPLYDFDPRVPAALDQHVRSSREVEVALVGVAPGSEVPAVSSQGQTLLLQPNLSDPAPYSVVKERLRRFEGIILELCQTNGTQARVIKSLCDRPRQQRCVTHKEMCTYFM